MKLLLYCTKSKPYLFDFILDQYPNRYGLYDKKEDCDSGEGPLNGLIVAECDFEVEKIIFEGYGTGLGYKGTKTSQYELSKRSCLYDFKDIHNYLKGKNGYAIHIKNLHIFNEPKELSKYSKRIGDDFQVLGNAPQNMMGCCELKYIIEDYILISIRPEWLCKILNGEKTIEVRKKVLKEML